MTLWSRASSKNTWQQHFLSCAACWRTTLELLRLRIAASARRWQQQAAAASLKSSASKECTTGCSTGCGSNPVQLFRATPNTGIERAWCLVRCRFAGPPPMHRMCAVAGTFHLHKPVLDTAAAGKWLWCRSACPLALAGRCCLARCMPRTSCCSRGVPPRRS